MVWQASAWLLERRHPERYGKWIQPNNTNDKDPFDEWLDQLKDAEDTYDRIFRKLKPGFKRTAG